jgi:hypothetical protein
MPLLFCFMILLKVQELLHLDLKHASPSVPINWLKIFTVVHSDD